MSERESSKPWATEQISVWVTQRRRAQLAKIAEGLPSGASPIQAIDRALDLATTPIFVPAHDAPSVAEPSARNDDLSQIEARISAIAKRLEQGFAAGLADIVSTVDRLSASVASLQAMMIEASDSDFPDIRGDDMVAEAREVREWLRVRLSALGLSETKLAIVRIAFRSESRQGDGRTAFEFDAKLGAIEQGDVIDSLETSRLKISGISATSPMLTLRSARSACLVARKISLMEWSVGAHLVDDEGKIQPALAHFVVK
ncbi:hypothetical protein [Caballeronia sp. BR00000012568055]|uniref:hypothetical protein n=1 Tax=Caballeronia sp. BR00000012568055 TaxID=2918761 RepID=UPI0023F92FFD|nr:hypothetical protein [Caballeronia sp. BR00000012568055]